VFGVPNAEKSAVSVFRCLGMNFWKRPGAGCRCGGTADRFRLEGEVHQWPLFGITVLGTPTIYSKKAMSLISKHSWPCAPE